MIWTDILPLCVFAALFAMYLQQNPSTLAVGVHLGVIVSRLCSSVYHIYNCYSLRANQRLINLDLIGICCMAFGSPYLYAIANRTDRFGDPGFLTYTGCMALQFTVCVGLFAYLLVSDSNTAHLTRLRQPLLVLLATTGNSPVLRMDTSCTSPGCLAWGAAFLFAAGYVVFYTLKVHAPFCSSHVLWHLTATSAQLCVVAMTFRQG